MQHSKELCNNCKKKINNEYRLEIERTVNYSPPQSKKSYYPFFLGVMLLPGRPQIRHVCVSVSHQLRGVGPVCQSVSGQ